MEKMNGTFTAGTQQLHFISKTTQYTQILGKRYFLTTLNDNFQH